MVIVSLLLVVLPLLLQNLVLLQRYATHGDSDRQWGNETTAKVAAAFQEFFPDHRVRAYFPFLMRASTLTSLTFS